MRFLLSCALMLTISTAAVAQTATNDRLLPYPTPAHTGPVTVSYPGEAVPTQPYVRVWASTVSYPGVKPLSQLEPELKAFAQRQGFDGIIIREAETEVETRRAGILTELLGAVVEGAAIGLVSTATQTNPNSVLRCNLWHTHVNSCYMGGGYTTTRRVTYVTLEGYVNRDRLVAQLNQQPRLDSLDLAAGNGWQPGAALVYQLDGKPLPLTVLEPAAVEIYNDYLRYYDAQWLLQDASKGWQTKTDRNGRVTRRTYAPVRHIISADIVYNAAGLPSVLKLERSYVDAAYHAEAMELTYDASGRIATQRLWLRSGELEVRYGYDAAGRLAYKEGYHVVKGQREPLFRLRRWYQQAEQLLAADAAGQTAN